MTKCVATAITRNNESFRMSGDTIWSIGGVTDLAPRYQNLGLTLGAWH